ncbi:MAG: hypothetical protein IJS82_04585 [Paludibacteraceae bacterium]|nr:hypothetical protein [Paludibacteraceae bacterium]
MDIYRELLESLQRNGYQLIGYADYIKSQKLIGASVHSDKFVILRHDVDAKPENSLRTAQIEHAFGAKATYYFRIGKESNQPEIIRAIVQLGHEIGYHYEDMSLCGGDVDKAWSHFQTWLAYFRQYYPVETICMHGSPRSKWDSKELWNSYDYTTLGIIGEPYLDTNFHDVVYYTDTGRCWDGYRMSVRDKIPGFQALWEERGLMWHDTFGLLGAIKTKRFPQHAIITTHPQRWANNNGEWWTEFIGQTAKNIAKRILVKVNE